MSTRDLDRAQADHDNAEPDSSNRCECGEELDGEDANECPFCEAKRIAREEENARAWNPRFTAYARAHNRDEDGQLAHDRIEFPGGLMTGYILWIGARWREWQKMVGRKDLTMLREWEQIAFTSWVLERAKEIAREG
jgi:hypothetical protein